MALHTTSGYGSFHALTMDLPEQELCLGLEYLSEMLENEHRGIRKTAVECIVLICRVQLTEGRVGVQRYAVREMVGRIVEGIIGRLEGDENRSANGGGQGATGGGGGGLYKRKQDLVQLVGNLASFTLSDLRTRVLNLLVSLWKDPDSTVRQTSIKMVRMLGEQGVKEVVDAFNQSSGGKSGSERKRE